MAYFILLIVILIYGSSLCFAYTDTVRDSKYFYLLSLGCSLCVGFLWAAGVKVSHTTERIFLFSLMWEFAVILTDYVVPLIFFGLNSNKYVTLGSLIVAAGLTVMKLGMK